MAKIFRFAPLTIPSSKLFQVFYLKCYSSYQILYLYIFLYLFPQRFCYMQIIYSINIIQVKHSHPKHLYKESMFIAVFNLHVHIKISQKIYHKHMNNRSKIFNFFLTNHTLKINQINIIILFKICIYNEFSNLKVSNLSKKILEAQKKKKILA